MEGLYVDSQHCMRIVTPEWIVYTAGKEEGWAGTIHVTTGASKRWVTLQTPTDTYRGAYDGFDCISWDNGDKWHRLSMSFVQWEFLSRRSYYIPSSFLFASYVYEGMRVMFTRIVGEGKV